MLKKISVCVVLGVLLFVGSANNAKSQDKSCAVLMEITNSGKELTGVAATALNLKTGKLYKAGLKGGSPYFFNLANGYYRVTVSKIGFMRSADDYNLDCEKLKSVNGAWSIELYKGNSKQIVRLYNRGRMLKAAPLKKEESSYYVIGKTSGAPETTYQDSESTKDAPKTVSGGVVNGKAINLVKPPYPAAARAVRAAGAVNVQVTIDEQGNVISAQAVSGHPLLRAASVQAARASTFSPTLLQGQPVKVVGIIVYNFVP